MIDCNEMMFEATVQWRNYTGIGRSTSSTEAKNKALDLAILKGKARGERFNPRMREWFVLKLSRSGRGSTKGCTFFGS